MQNRLGTYHCWAIIDLMLETQRQDWQVSVIQLNLSSMATLGTEESGHCQEVAVVERLLLAEVQLYTYFLPDISL